MASQQMAALIIIGFLLSNVSIYSTLHVDFYSYNCKEAITIVWVCRFACLSMPVSLW